MRKLLVAFLVIISLVNAHAQFYKRTPYRPELSVGFNTGVNYLWAEGFRSYSIFQGMGVLERLSIGYQFTPLFGIRGGMGITTHNWPDKNDPFKTNRSFMAENLTGDLFVNFTNWLYGYDYNRNFYLSIYVGGGVGERPSGPSFSNDMITSIYRGGLEYNYYISNSVTLNIQGELNIVDDAFNNNTEGFPFDIYPAITVGIHLHLPTDKTILYPEKFDYNLNRIVNHKHK